MFIQLTYITNATFILCTQKLTIDNIKSIMDEYYNKLIVYDKAKEADSNININRMSNETLNRILNTNKESLTHEEQETLDILEEFGLNEIIIWWQNEENLKILKQFIKKEIVDYTPSKCTNTTNTTTQPNSYCVYLGVDSRRTCIHCKTVNSDHQFKTNQTIRKKIESIQNFIYEICCELYHSSTIDQDIAQYLEITKLPINKSDQTHYQHISVYNTNYKQFEILEKLDTTYMHISNMSSIESDIEKYYNIALTYKTCYRNDMNKMSKLQMNDIMCTDSKDLTPEQQDKNAEILYTLKHFELNKLITWWQNEANLKVLNEFIKKEIVEHTPSKCINTANAKNIPNEYCLYRSTNNNAACINCDQCKSNNFIKREIRREKIQEILKCIKNIFNDTPTFFENQIIDNLFQTESTLSINNENNIPETAYQNVSIYNKNYRIFDMPYTQYKIQEQKTNQILSDIEKYRIIVMDVDRYSLRDLRGINSNDMDSYINSLYQLFCLENDILTYSYISYAPYIKKEYMSTVYDLLSNMYKEDSFYNSKANTKVYHDSRDKLIKFIKTGNSVQNQLSQQSSNQTSDIDNNQTFTGTTTNNNQTFTGTTTNNNQTFTVTTANNKQNAKNNSKQNLQKANAIGSNQQKSDFTDFLFSGKTLTIGGGGGIVIIGWPLAKKHISNKAKQLVNNDVKLNKKNAKLKTTFDEKKYRYY